MLSFFKRLRALGDKSAWLLIAPAAMALFFIDASAAKTLLQWSLFGIVLAGVSIVISRIVFPQINLTDLVQDAYVEHNRASGLIASALILFVALIFIGLVVWAKA